MTDGFGLVVRFTCKDQTSAEAFDRLVAETAEKIRAHEPGTLVYAVHQVEGGRCSGSSTSFMPIGPPSNRMRRSLMCSGSWQSGSSI